MNHQINRPFAYGLTPFGEISGIPAGAKVRIRRRVDDFAKVFIQIKGATSLHGVERQPDGTWRLTEAFAETRRFTA